eukprot:981648-Heterocapsa_arctica.AAC.1
MDKALDELRKSNAEALALAAGVKKQMDDEKQIRDAAPPGGPPGLPQPDLEGLLRGIEERLGKFV